LCTSSRSSWITWPICLYSCGHRFVNSSIY